MRFKTLSGKENFLNIEKRRIKWDAPSLSKFQFEVKQFLRKYWTGQVCYEEMRLVGTLLKFDFYNASKKIAVECSGPQHGAYNKFFHKGNKYNYLFQIKRDDKKWRWCEINNIKLIYIEPTDLPLTKKFFENNGIFL
jgi:hypothetical protein